MQLIRRRPTDSRRIRTVPKKMDRKLITRISRLRVRKKVRISRQMRRMRPIKMRSSASLRPRRWTERM